jgi:predicted metal-dependent phosphoesterase TrpH
MILDLHSHSVQSDDGRAKVENYCQWIRKRELPLDGFVLTEHRQWDATSDYRKLEDEFGLLILKASEVETEYGHVLLFGVNEELTQAFDFSRVDLRLAEVVAAARQNDAIAVPCHPGRVTVGMCAHYDTLGPVDGVEVIETLNGGSRGTENEEAIALAERYGYRGIGGSDAHIVSFIGRCATKFENEIRSIADLVSELRDGACEAISFKE